MFLLPVRFAVWTDVLTPMCIQNAAGYEKYALALTHIAGGRSMTSQLQTSRGEYSSLIVFSFSKSYEI